MSKGFTLISPTVYESNLTGYMMSGEKTIRGQMWRVDIYKDRVEFYKNGQVLTWSDATKEGKKFYNEAVTVYNQWIAAEVAKGAEEYA